MTSALIAGLAFGLFMAISVGPTIFAILKYSISYGWKAGMSFVIGVSLSDIIFVILFRLNCVYTHRIIWVFQENKSDSKQTRHGNCFKSGLLENFF